MEIKRLDRKVKIKNIMIIFLVVMLILTFFSNTIMNYSVPEVSVCKLSSGVISRIVDASAIIESNQENVIFADEDIEIKRTAVKKGQAVEEGQILFYLNTGEENSEVKELKNMIDEAKLQYEKDLLDLGNDYFAENQQVQMARDQLDAAIAARDNAAINSSQSEIFTVSSTELNKRLNLINRDIEAIESDNYDALSSDSKAKLQNELNNYNLSNREYVALSEALAQNVQMYSGDIAFKESERHLAELKITLDRLTEDKADKRKIEDAQIAYDYALADHETLSALKQTIDDQKAKLTLAESSKATAFAALEPKINELLDCLISERFDIEQNILVSENESSDKYKFSSDENCDYDLAVNDAKYSLDAAVHELEIKIKSDSIQNKSKKLDLEAAKKKIEEQEKKLAELIKKNGMSEITSPVSGIIQEIYVVTGAKIASGEQLLKIDILDEGFKAVVTLSKDAAEAVYKGQDAKVTDFSDVNAVVQDIVKSKNTPNSVEVTLKITGDVESGQQIRIQFSKSSDQTSNVIPKTAVKEDASGQFIYGVISRNTPIGNRYTAKKIPVSIMSEDDKQCSVSGEFGDCEDYIIISSSKPFSSGDKVRLAGE